MSTLRELLTASLRLLGVVQADVAPHDADLVVATTSLTALIDAWSATRLNIYSISPTYYPMTPSKKDYTLGPGGDWEASRPMRIEQALVTRAVPITKNIVVDQLYHFEAGL